MLEVGRMCVKTAGREAGRYCVIVKKVDANFVMVTGPKSVTKVRRRKCNIDHLEPLMENISIKADASDEEVAKVYKSDGILAKLEKRVRAEPRPVEVKPVKAEPAKHEAKPAEKRPEAKPPEKKPKEVKKEKPKAVKKAAKKSAAKAKPAKKAKAKAKKK